MFYILTMLNDFALLQNFASQMAGGFDDKAGGAQMGVMQGPMVRFHTHQSHCSIQTPSDVMYRTQSVLIAPGNPTAFTYIRVLQELGLFSVRVDGDFSVVSGEAT